MTIVVVHITDQQQGAIFRNLAIGQFVFKIRNRGRGRIAEFVKIKFWNGHILAAKSSPAVVVLTSYHDEQEEMVLSELGVSRYLLKDIDSNGLYQEIIGSYTEREEAYSNSG